MHCLQNKTSHILACQNEGLRKKMKHMEVKKKSGVIKDDRKEINFLSCGHMLSRWCSMKSIPVLISASTWASRVFACWSGACWKKAKSRRLQAIGEIKCALLFFWGVFFVMLIWSCVKCADSSLELSSKDAFLYLNSVPLVILWLESPVTLYISLHTHTHT